MIAINNPCSNVSYSIDINTELTTDEKAVAFRLDKLPLEPRTFGLGLVLGGTVSAGAFTAGVLDFLVEALDEWQFAREAEDAKVKSGAMGDADRTVPTHKVALSIITGASGGGVCGAILARFLGFRFPHVCLNPNSPNNANDPQLVAPTQPWPNPNIGFSLEDNPFWNVWVNQLRIDGMLNKNNAGESLLSADAIALATQSISQDPRFAKNPRDKLPYTQPQRDWLHKDFNIVLTLTNLRGIPTYIRYMGGKQSFMERADFIRFGVTAATGPVRAKACHESMLLGPMSSESEWGQFAQFAVATGAFPGGFPACELNRCITDYRFRPVIKPNEGAGVDVIPLPIDTAVLAGAKISPRSEYAFLAVDGGATNNAPVELARSYLSGLGGRNKRDADAADRAIVIIDPLAEQVRLDDAVEAQKKSLLKVLSKLVLGLVNENRYHSRDIMLSVDEKIKSRFLLTASRPDWRNPGNTVTGSVALCSARLQAFFGFFDKEFSQHDFFLGRYCCQKFLRDKVDGLCVQDNNDQIGVPHPKDEMIAVIPLYGTAFVEQKLPGWPIWNTFDPDSLKGAVSDRLDAVLNAQLDGLKAEHGFWFKLGVSAWFSVNKWLMSSKLVDMVTAAITDAKKDPGLPPL